MYTGPREDEPDERAAALLREERERDERAARRNHASWVVVGWMMAGALVLLAYDSGAAALDAHRSGRSWSYPAGVSAVSALLLVWLVVRVVRRRRRRVSYRGPG